MNASGKEKKDKEAMKPGKEKKGSLPEYGEPFYNCCDIAARFLLTLFVEKTDWGYFHLFC